MKRRKSKKRSLSFLSNPISGRGAKSDRSYRPRLEQLESRLLLATTTVIGNGGDWHAPSTWDNGVPTALVDAVVPIGKTVLLAGTNHVAQSLRIQGTAAAVENGITNKTLSADWILVDGGAFRVGTVVNRYDTNTLTITLEGDNPSQDISSLGISSNDAFLMSRAGGTIDLFGSLETSWTQLGVTVLDGQDIITLKEAVTWNVGDEIVIASTTFDMNQAETRTITTVSSDQKTLRLSAPLSFDHYGELQFYDNGKGTNYELDERAEVGLLTHSIKIQGDADSTVDGIGGNLMFMPDSGAVHIDGVELYHMGQKSRLARYPVHWHLAGDRTGDYVKNTSIHRSFNRAVVIHASHNVLVEQTVAYDHIGSGYFLENAVETGNKFYYNLGLVTREPVVGEELLPTDLGPKQFQISGPGTFWITNPDNEFVGNVAAGSQNGSGFWYAFPTGPLNQSINDPQYAGVNPQTTALGLFQGNRAHSNAIGLDVDGGPNVVTDVAESAHYAPPIDANFSDFTAFANSKNGVYFRGTSRLKLPNARLADNVQGTMFAFAQTISDSLIVGVSDNDFGGAKKHGFAVYDGPNTVRNVHFAGFNDPGAGLFSIIGAANRHGNHIFEQITFDDPNTPFTFPNTSANNTLSRHWGFALYDADGTLTGVAGQSIIYDHPMMRSIGDVVLPSWEQAVVSRRRFGHLKLNHGLSPAQQPTVTFDRTDGPGADESFTDLPQHEPFTQLGVVMNTDFIYSITYDTELLSGSFNINVEEVNSNDFVYIRVKSPWPGITANSAVAQSSIQDVKNSNQSAYYLEPSGDVFLKVFGQDGVNLFEAPAPYLYADFESGIDPRASLAATHGGLMSGLSFSGTFGSLGSVNNYDVIDNGDGINGFVDFHYGFSTPQDATGLDDLIFSTLNENDTPMQVHIHDASAGFTFLGNLPTGDESLSLTSVAANRRDQIDDILIRVFESSFSDLNTFGNSVQINLNNIAATVSGTSIVVNIADFDSGVDPNGSLAATHFGLNTPLTSTANLGADGINYWDVIDNGDGLAGFVDLHMSFGPEDWSGLGGLRINTANELDTPIQVFIRDVSAGYTAPWNLASGDQWVSLSAIPAANRDQIDDLIIRVHESSFSDLVSPGNQIRVHLKHIEATFEDPNPPLPSSDFDGDGDFDGADFLSWQRGFGKPNANKLDGDADNDQDVDGQDLAFWQTQFGGTTTVSATASAMAVSAANVEETALVGKLSADVGLAASLDSDLAQIILQTGGTKQPLLDLALANVDNQQTTTVSAVALDLALSEASKPVNRRTEALAAVKALHSDTAGNSDAVEDAAYNAISDEVFALLEEGISADLQRLI